MTRRSWASPMRLSPRRSSGPIEHRERLVDGDAIRSTPQIASCVAISCRDRAATSSARDRTARRASRPCPSSSPEEREQREREDGAVAQVGVAEPLGLGEHGLHLLCGPSRIVCVGSTEPWFRIRTSSARSARGAIADGVGRLERADRGLVRRRVLAQLRKELRQAAASARARSVPSDSVDVPIEERSRRRQVAALVGAHRGGVQVLGRSRGELARAARRRAPSSTRYR